MTRPERPGLLVSVRSAEEAVAALAGGADLIDVKEPSRGPLGRADDAVIAEVVRVVAGRKPVSAALGELVPGDPAEDVTAGLPRELSYLKWGLAGWNTRLRSAWIDQLAQYAWKVGEYLPDSQLVAVAYADWQRAQAPSPQEVWEGIREVQIGPVRRFKCQVLLIDTWQKDGTTLLDWLPQAHLQRLCKLCQNGGLPIALAGSLDVNEIVKLKPVQPDWFAVRGAACVGGRAGVVDEAKVRELAALLTHS